MAKKPGFLFEEAAFAEKRLLCETVFRCLYIEDGRIIKIPELNSSLGLISVMADFRVLPAWWWEV